MLVSPELAAERFAAAATVKSNPVREVRTDGKYFYKLDRRNRSFAGEFAAAKLLEAQERRIRENSALTLLIEEKRQTENAINNIMEAIEQGGTSATVMKRMHDLEAKLEEIERQTAIEQSKQAFRLTKDEIQQFYKAGLQKDPLRMINLFVKEILLFNDKMIITYNTPQKMDLGESQGFSFYDRIVKIPFFFQDRNDIGLRDFRLIMAI